LQVVDIVTLRPEVELCYMGIANKCFEILENKPHQYDYHNGDAYNAADGGNGGASGYTPIQDGELTDEEEEELDDDDMDGGADDAQSDDDAANDDDDDDDDLYSNDGDVTGKPRPPKLRLREILFYDDKVSIFKARHGKL
jgi:hypothetical protein